MERFFLATKVRIPPQPRRAVSRGRLIDLLERDIPHCKLVHVSAPAGYGKTTLLVQWARTSRFPVAWLSIGEEDNDLERFFRYLLAAWEEIQPAVADSPLGVLLSGMSPDSEAVLAAFINAAIDVPDHIVFVLDEYHLIEDPAIHDALTFLLDHLPPTLHFVLAGRAEAPLPLARYRARIELLELHAADLLFLPDETTEFLNGLMGLDLAHDEVVRLQAQLEGWIAGLQLVALTLQRRSMGDEGRRMEQLVLSGRHRFIADYLSEDVLAHLPEELSQFLLQTGILDRLCGSLCDAITGREGGQAMLEALERENLFLVPLDDSRQWFRYHRLFADFLRGELQRRYPDEVPDLHRRAAKWCLAHELPEPAFHHAVEGSDVRVAVQIVDRYTNAKLMCGEFKVLKHWLEVLPAEWYNSYPVFGIARAGLLAYSGQLDACIRCIDEVEQRLLFAETDDTRWQLARVTVLRCFMACMHNDLTRAEHFADQALRELPEDDLGFRPGIYAALGDAYRQHARWEEAEACYLKVLDFTHAPSVRLQSAHVYGALADLDLRQGRLRDAAAYWRKALAVIQERENWGHYPLPVIGWVYIRMGEILYEWNELAEAWDHLSRGLERVELGGDVRALIAGYLLAGRVKLTEGDIEAAEEYLERARPLIENAPFPDWIGHFGRFQLECWLAQDRLRAAVHWADEMLQSGEMGGGLESAVAQLAMARVLIVKGDAPSVAQAQALLARVLDAAEGEGRAGVMIEAFALQALAYWRRGDQASAMTTLERALRMAEPEGYVRLFADFGLSMGRLLQEARARAVMPDYVDTLLAAFGAEFPFPASMEGALPEPLSQREQEVLQLIAAGLTNREIAEQLVISAQTVKKHTGNIYGKLGVSNRTEAAAKARELDLLD